MDMESIGHPPVQKETSIRLFSFMPVSRSLSATAGVSRVHGPHFASMSIKDLGPYEANPLDFPKGFIHADALSEDHEDQAVRASRIDRVMSNSTRSFPLRHQPHTVVARWDVSRPASIQITVGHISTALENDRVTRIGEGGTVVAGRVALSRLHRVGMRTR